MWKIVFFIIQFLCIMYLNNCTKYTAYCKKIEESNSLGSLFTCKIKYLYFKRQENCIKNTFWRLTEKIPTSIIYFNQNTKDLRFWKIYTIFGIVFRYRCLADLWIRHILTDVSRSPRKYQSGTFINIAPKDDIPEIGRIIIKTVP